MQARSLDLSRRGVVQGLLCLGPLALVGRAGAATGAAALTLAEIERIHGGRLGVGVWLGGSDLGLGCRVDERFALCSTFKILLAGAVLTRVDRGEERLDRTLPVTQGDLIANSSVTGARVGQRMSLEALCHATVTTSDNTAANLLLGVVGGPEGLTAALRALGDTVTRLDRREPELNLVDWAAGDTRDTTTPAAMTRTLASLAVGDALTPSSRVTLVGWMRAAVTGLSRLRAAIPPEWSPGDKTGTGPDGPTNDVAVAWPPGRPPLVLTAWYDRAGHTMEENAAVLAEVARVVVAQVME